MYWQIGKVVFKCVRTAYTFQLGFTQQFNDRLALELEADYFSRKRRLRHHPEVDYRYAQEFSRISLLFRFMPLDHFYVTLGPSINFRFDSKLVIGKNSMILAEGYPPRNVTTYGGNVGFGYIHNNFFINLNYLSEIPAQKWDEPETPSLNGNLYKRISSLRLTVGYSFKILKEEER